MALIAAQASVNFVTCHDGFTLNDLVSYDSKHNEANGEGNRDGNDQNLSWNCGVEGPTTDPAIERLRRRQVKNFLVLDLLSLGAPMLLMGDEVRRSQAGNNNAYCRNDATSWFDWSATERDAELLRFTRGLTRLRCRLATLFDVPEGTHLLDLLRDASYTWSGVASGSPTSASRRGAWRSPSERMRGTPPDLQRLLGCARVRVAHADAGIEGWRRIVDTYLESPDDLADTYEDAPEVTGSVLRAEGRSVVGPRGPPKRCRDRPGTAR